MLDKKVNEFQMAFKKFITRLLILAAIVVFGAIAIAQAPRSDLDNDATIPQNLVGDANAMPSPDHDASVSNVSYEAQAGDENPDSSAFSDMSPVESTSMQDASPIESNDVVVDTDVEPADSFADAEYDDIGLPDATNLANEGDLATQYEESYESVPDLLDEETTVDVPRPNPYRRDQATDEEIAATGDDYYGNATELPAADIAVDDTNLAPIEGYEVRGAADLADTDALPPYEDEFSSDDSSLSIPNEGTSELSYQDPPSTTDNNLRSRNSNSGQPRVNRSYESAQEFGRTERIEENPLPQKYAIARSNNRSTGSGRPGPQNLEGPQTPSLSIEKIAPNEVQVGKQTRFQIKIRNVGQVPANNVIIRDEVPEGTIYLGSSPESQGDQSSLLWEVGTINPGDETVITVEVEPTDEGQVGSTATVSFEASATARARSTKPSLVIEHTSPRQVLVGEPVKFAIKLSNPGSGTATQVVLDEDVPRGLSHSSGPKLEYEVGTILPGQTRHLELTLTAAEAGKVTNVLVARGDAGLIAKDTIELNVVAPDLQVQIEGPNRRYLERQATFTVSVANPGTATAKNVELVAQLPRGLKFLSTNNQGHYDQSRHAVVWNLEQLPANEMGKAQFKAIPIEMGDFDVRAEAKADRNLAAEKNHRVRVEGIAALYFGVADKVDPVEVGGQTTYVINVENQGSKTATNIRFRAQVPAGMQAVSGRGATQAIVNGQMVDFDPIAKLPPKAKTSFEIIVRGTQPGDQKLRVQMVSDEIQTPVIKEESTRVYTD